MNTLKQIVLAAAVLLAGVAQAQSYNVTFRVDMSEQTPDTVISIAGNFQAAAGYASDWTPGISPLTDPDMDGVYTLTVSIPAGSYEYKFINGSSWGQDEGVPGACNVNGNRGVTVTGDMVLDAVCFGSCDVCPFEAVVQWQVDMSNESVGGQVSIAGNFQSAAGGTDWTPGTFFLTDPDMDGIYTRTDTFLTGSYEYKYLNGVSWGQDEGVPGACQVNGNRGLTLTGDTVLTPVCFGTCSECCRAPGNLGFENLSDTEVRLTWDVESSATAYKVRWKVAGSSMWNTDIKHSNQGQYQVTGLTAGTTYKWQVATKCGAEWSAWTDRERFVTLAVACSAPSGLSSSPVGYNKARLNWTAPSSATTVRLRWREQGTSQWTYRIKDADKALHWATGLSTGTTYEWQIQSYCHPSDPLPGDWSAVQTFTTAAAQKQSLDVLAKEDARGLVALFPNPNNGTFTVVFDEAVEQDATIEVISSIGQVVAVERVSVSDGTNRIVQLNDALPGVYFVRVQSAEMQWVQRVVVR